VRITFFPACQTKLFGWGGFGTREKASPTDKISFGTREIASPAKKRLISRRKNEELFMGQPLAPGK